jgi:hypothetical protein
MFNFVHHYMVSPYFWGGELGRKFLSYIKVNTVYQGIPNNKLTGAVFFIRE